MPIFIFMNISFVYNFSFYLTRYFPCITIDMNAKNFAAIFTAIRGADPEMKKFIGELIKDFGLLLFHNLRSRHKSVGELPTDL